MTFTPKHEGITGADLSGSDADTNRTYTLTNSNAILAGMQFIVDGAILQANKDFTFDSNSLVVTFLNKIWDDMIISLDYFVQDDSSSVNYLSDRVSFSGGDLHGIDGGTGRNFIFVSSKQIIYDMMQVVVDNTALTRGTDFTFDEFTKRVTFLTAIFDTSSISIDYLYIGFSYYTNTRNIVQYSGLGVEIFLEELGTGDNSNKSFDVDNNNVIEGTLILTYGDENNLVKLIENEDYMVSIDDGRVYLFSSGVSKVGTTKLYATYIYSPRHSNSMIESMLSLIDSEVDYMTGSYWGAPKTSIEYFNGNRDEYPHTDSPFSSTYQNENEFILKNKGINSITSILVLDQEGNTDQSADTNKIRFEDHGLVYSGMYSIPTGRKNVKITYVHGYDEVPNMIALLASYLGGLNLLVNVSGGSYKDVSTYTIGRKTFSIGQVYVNIESSVRMMQNRINQILMQLGSNYVGV